MSRRQFLRIDSLGLEIWQTNGHDHRCVERLSPPQIADFARWVVARPRGARIRILIDVGEEAYETEVLPRVRGADRRALIARRLAQWFPQPLWARADALPDRPREHGGATERVLFSGLTRPERIEPWIDALRSADVRIECIIPASALLAACSGLADGLLVSFSQAGMRLTLVEEGRARLSRLVEDYPATTAGQNTDWLSEIARTVRYASTVVGGTVQPVVGILAAAAALPSTCTLSSAAEHGLELRWLDPASFGIFTGEGKGLDCSHLLLHWLNKASPRLGWQTPASPGRMSRPQRLFVGVSASICVAGMAAAALNWQDAARLTQEHAAQEAALSAKRELLASIDASIPPLPATPDLIRSSAEQFEQATRLRAPTQALFEHVSRALEEGPAARLHSLAWELEAPGVAITLTLTQATRQDIEAIARRLEHLGPVAVEPSRPDGRSVISVRTALDRLGSERP